MNIISYGCFLLIAYSYDLTAFILHSGGQLSLYRREQAENFLNNENDTKLAEVTKGNYKNGLKDYKQNFIIESNWEQAVVAAPMAVAFMAQLVLLGGEKDFDLHSDAEFINMTRILRNSRFKPAMIQLGNQAWKSFNTAEKNTNKLRSMMVEITRSVKSAARMLVKKATPKQLAKGIAIPLNDMKEKTEDAVVRAIEIENSFIETMLLLHEISERLVATESVAQEKLQESKEMQEILEQQIKLTNQSIDNAKSYMKKVEKQLNDSQKAFEKAMEAIPTGWDAVAQNLVANLNPTQALADLAKTAVSVFKIKSDAMTGLSSSRMNGIISDQVAFKISGGNVNAMGQAKSFLQKTINMDSSMLNDAREQFLGLMKTLKIGGEAQINQIKSLVATNMSTKVSLNAEHLVETSQQAINTLQDKSVNIQKFAGELMPKLTNVMRQATQVSSKAAVQNGMSPVPEQKPSDGKFKVGENERVKAGIREKVLIENQRRMDEQFFNLQKLNQENANAMLEMSQLKFDIINTEAIKEIVVKAIIQLVKLQEYWNTLVSFFQTLTTSVEIQLNTAVSNFRKYVNVTVQNDDPMAMFNLVKDEIYNNMMQINVVAKSIEVVTETYFQYSQKYVTRALSKHLELTILNKEQREAMRVEITTNSSRISDEVLDMCRKKKNSFDAEIEKKKKEVHEIYAIAGEPTEEERSDMAALDLD